MCLRKEDSHLKTRTMAIKILIVVCFGTRRYVKVYRQVCDLQVPFLKGADSINSRDGFAGYRYPSLTMVDLIDQRTGLLNAGTLLLQW